MVEPCPASIRQLDYADDLNMLYPVIPPPLEQLIGRTLRDDPIIIGDIKHDADKPKIVDVEKELMKGATTEDERTQRMRTRLRNKIRRSSRKTGSK